MRLVPADLLEEVPERRGFVDQQQLGARDVREVLEHGESWTGHDVRAAARNIVVETPDAQATFARIAAFLTRAGLIDDVVVGARPLAGTDFVTLWPPGGEPFDHR